MTKSACSMLSLLALFSTHASLCAQDVFQMPAGVTSLEFVEVGDPGNAPDDIGLGAVTYPYKIGKHEVTTVSAWATNHTDYNIMNGPLRRDITKELADACHEAGIGFFPYETMVGS